MQQQIPKSSAVFIASAGFAAICAGVLFSYFGYLWGMLSPNPGELLGSFFFWFGIIGLLFTFPLREATRDFMHSVRTRLGGGFFVVYMAVHLVLYSFLLEGILSATSGGYIVGVISPGLFVTTDVFGPPSLNSALFDLAYNPSIILTSPPFFIVALSLYSISLAFIISVLVVANIGKTRELARLCSLTKRGRSYVLVPALGIALGASCCLSVAGLVSLYTLPLTLYLELASNLFVYYITYFLLPAFAVVILALNLHSVRKISAGIVHG